MLGFADARIDEWATLIVHEIGDGGPGIHAGELLIVVAEPNKFPAQGPEVVAMPAHRRVGQTPIQQMEQKGRERGDDLLADVDVRWLVVP